MNKRKIILPLLFLISLMIFLLVGYWRYNHALYQAAISSYNTGSKIKVSLENFEKDKPIDQRNLATFARTIYAENKNIVFVTIFDSNHKILLSGKNDYYLQNENELGSIEKELLSGNNLQKKYLVRNIHYKKFYIFPQQVSGGVLAAGLLPQLGKVEISALTVELALTLALMIIIIVSVLRFITRSGSSINFIENITTLSSKGIDERIKQNSNLIYKNFRDEINESIYGWFERLALKISQETDFTEITLLVPTENNRHLKKIFQYSGKLLLTITENEKDYISTDDGWGLELTRKATIILEQGKMVLLPVSGKNGLAGVLKLNSSETISGNILGNIRIELNGVENILDKYILRSKNFIDASNGLITENSWKSFYEEKLSAQHDHGIPFMLLGIALNPISMENNINNNELIKTTGQYLYTEFGPRAAITVLQNYFVIATSIEKGEDFYEKIAKNTFELKIKIANDTPFTVTMQVTRYQIAAGELTADPFEQLIMLKNKY